jgi:hypothetical protein
LLNNGRGGAADLNWGRRRLFKGQQRRLHAPNGSVSELAMNHFLTPPVRIAEANPVSGELFRVRGHVGSIGVRTDH